jgi:hypothetical protein
MSDKGALVIPPELSEMVREASGEPNRLCFAGNLQVSDAIDPGLPSLMPVPPDRPREESAGSRVLSEGVRPEDGPGLSCPIYFSCDASGRTVYFPRVDGPILAFDIETTGLCDRDAVTCVCAFDPDRGIRFGRCTPDGSACDEFLLLLDEAPLLCAFNGVRFDVPFLAKRWKVSAARAGAWARKLVDPFEACRLALRRTFSLDRLLAANGLACKTGSGLEAVAMAREGRWAELEEYCMADTVKTHQVVKLGRVKLPEPVDSVKKKTC